MRRQRLFDGSFLPGRALLPRAARASAATPSLASEGRDADVRLGDVTLRDISAQHDADDAPIVSEQLRQLIRTAPVLLAAHLIGGAGLLWVIWSTGDLRSLMTAMALIFLTLFIDASFSSLARLELVQRRPPWFGARLATAYGMLVGLSWSALLLIGMPEQQVGEQAVIGIAFAGTGTVAALVMATVPIVLIVHWVILICALAISFGSTAIALTLSGICFCVAAVAIMQARRRTATTRHYHEQDRKGRTARALLAEFEHGGKSWLWETDAQGQLTYISPHVAQMLARALAKDATALVGMPMADLIVSAEGHGAAPQGSERTLGFHLSTRLPFSDLTVQARARGGERWWTLSGRPAFDEFSRFTGFRGVGTDLSELHRSDAEINRLARYDALTGLPNRVVMRQTLEHALHADGVARPDPCALFLLDLDRFKAVNDTLGHPVGDALLRQVAERLSRSIGERGRVGRLGGDEFSVILPGLADRRELAALADATIAALSQPYVIEGATLSIGASVGIAIAPADGACADSIVRNADLALYAAKAAGKGQHRFYESAMQVDARDRRMLETDLRHVLRDNGLHLVYQPIVNAATEQLVGFEALLRWNHPTRGAVPPRTFIPLAEEIGLIPAIGEWVIRTACAEAAHWPEPIRIAVNLSPLQFASPALPGIVMGALATSGLAPHRLELELTERVFAQDAVTADESFARLAAIGVRLALDDFGTGYASLDHLRRAPLNKIKIDQSFLRDAHLPGSRNAAIIRALVALADSLEMETVAEGIETPEEVTLIRSLGCSQIQGYIFGKPMPPADARQLVARGAPLEPKSFGTSREARMAILRSAVLHCGDRSFNVRVRNISTGGAMAETERSLIPDSRVEIEFGEGQRLGGEVRWSEHGRLGIKFDAAIDIDRIPAHVPGLASLPAAAPPAETPAPSERRTGSRVR